jgi:hypothetical protein
MITIALVFAHAFSSNKNFQPTILYLGTIIADCEIARYFFT